MIRTSPNADSSSASTPNAAEPLHLLWIGDATLAKRYVARRAPHVHITSSDSAGAADVLSTQKAPADKTIDLVVVDTAAPACNPLQLLSIAGAEGIDLPAILLAQPGDEDWTARAGRLTVCDTLVQTQDYLHQLLSTVTQVRLRHDATMKLEKARRGEQHLKAIVESLPHAVCTVDREGRVATANHAGLQLLGARIEDVVTTRLVDFVPEADAERILIALDNARNGEPQALRHLVRRPDGAVREVRSEIVPFPSADGGAALLTLHEWSERQSDEELAQLTQRMNDALGEAEAARRELERERAEAVQRAETAEALRAKETAEYERQTTALEILLDEARTAQSAARSEAARLQAALASAESERAASETQPQQPPAAVAADAAPASDWISPEQEAAHERLALQLQAAEARCLALTATVAQLAEQAQTARVSEADATAIFASRCRQLSDELSAAKTAATEHEERCRQLSVELESVKSAIAAHDEQCAELTEEIAALRESMAASDERFHKAADAESRQRSRAGQLAQRLAEDHQEFAGIRQELMRVLADTEKRCEALASRGAAILETLTSESGDGSTGDESGPAA